MARSQYFVVLHENQWKVKHNGKHYGPYRTQENAIRAAVDAAQATGRLGMNTQVLVQGRNHRFRAEWSYGSDPYPPAG